MVSIYDSAATRAEISPGRIIYLTVSRNANSGYCTGSIFQNYRIVQTVGKHVIAENTLAGGNEGIGVEETAECGIVITALEVIETQLNRIDIALAAYE